VRGLVSIVAGLIAFLMPGITAFALLVVIAAWAIVAGISEIAMAVRLRKMIEYEWLLGLEGALSIAFGVLLLLSPLAGAIVIGLSIGAYALVLGGMLIVEAFRPARVSGIRVACAMQDPATWTRSKRSFANIGRSSWRRGPGTPARSQLRLRSAAPSCSIICSS
jgi:hypothetical protein